MGGEGSELGQLSALGLCIRVAELKPPAPALVPLLHIGEYLPFYLRREEDELAERYLAGYGLLIVGRPLSGKTRMALEAIAAVVPDGILLRVSGPERLQNLGAVEVPRIAVGGKRIKASLVLLLDDLDRFDHAPVDALLERLVPQLDKLYVVGTCRTGTVQRAFASDSLRSLTTGLLSMSRMVHIPPLSPLQAAQVEKEVWKTNPGRDLGFDRTEVGVILYGARTIRPSYAALPGDAKRVLRALFLCEQIVSPCPPDLLRTVADRLPGNGAPDSLERTLEALIEKDIVQRDDSSRLSIVSLEHKESINAEHYGLVAGLKSDLGLVAKALEEQGDWARLTALGVRFGDGLNDLAEARRLLEASLRIERHADTLVSLSLVLARAGAEDAARPVLEECLNALPDPDRRANHLLRFGDEFYLRGRRAAALPHYLRARELAKAPATVLAATFRAADTQLFGGEHAAAEPIYRGLIGQAPEDSRPFAEARLIVSLVGQRRFDDAAREARAQLRRRETDPRKLFALSLLENGENLFLADERLGWLRRIAWEAFRDTNDEAKRGDDCRALAAAMLTYGYLSGAKLVYAELLERGEGFRPDSIEHTEVLNNLATCHLYLRETGQARPLYEEALKILRKQKHAEQFFILASEDGLAVCDTFDGKYPEAKKRCEALLKLATTIENETAKAWVRVCLGEIAWLQGDTAAAAEHFFALRALPNSLETMARADRGLARVNLHLRRLDNADLHIARGLAACIRADFAWLRKDFEALRGELDALKAAPGAASGARRPAKSLPIDALIMKGGGVKGLAFTGAIRELEAYYSFNTYVGTSAGSIAAALLAAGASGAQLEDTLRKTSFTDFLDCPLLQLPIAPILLLWRGLHPGDTFVTWLRKTLYKYFPGLTDVALKRLPKRAVLYASTADLGPITFDSQGEWAALNAFAAVRCSMSIPFFFRPASHNGKEAYDGGILNNYPVEIFLAAEASQGRQPKFIALYLGPTEPDFRPERGPLLNVSKILFEKNDAQVVETYRDDTIVIDTRPIGTIDFDMNDQEKDFLVLLGRAAALQHLKKRGHLRADRLQEAEKMAAEVEAIRGRILWRSRLRLALRLLKIGAYLASYAILAGWIVWWVVAGLFR